MSEKKTHRLVKNPTMSARDLADYMVASETARRTIVRDSKYRPIARIMQHNEAKMAVSKFVRSGGDDPTQLTDTATQLRSRMADNDFERDLYDHNADYIEKFAEVHRKIEMPVAELMAAGAYQPLTANGVKVSPDIQFRLKRITRTNKIKVGASVLRYAKGKAAPEEACMWHSAFLFGYLGETGDGTVEPEHKLCLTIDAYAGIAHAAPTDAVRRFSNMLAACASIAERWPNVAPPPNAVT